jgi:hypothetical protein
MHAVVRRRSNFIPIRHQEVKVMRYSLHERLRQLLSARAALSAGTKVQLEALEERLPTNNLWGTFGLQSLLPNPNLAAPNLTEAVVAPQAAPLTAHGGPPARAPTVTPPSSDAAGATGDNVTSSQVGATGASASAALFGLLQGPLATAPQGLPATPGNAAALGTGATRPTQTVAAAASGGAPAQALVVSPSAGLSTGAVGPNVSTGLPGPTASPSLPVTPGLPGTGSLELPAGFTPNSSGSISSLPATSAPPGVTDAPVSTDNTAALQSILGPGSGATAALLASAGVTPDALTGSSLGAGQMNSPPHIVPGGPPVGPPGGSGGPILTPPITTGTLPYPTPTLTAAQLSITNSTQMLWLTPTVLANLRAAAAANTSQWQAFQGQLNTGLTQISTTNGAYEGSELTQITDYALGYQVLKTSNPAVAQNYADKALGLMSSALMGGYEQGVWLSRQYLARGNGTTTTFTIPNSDYVPSSLSVYLGPVTTQAIVHGTGPSDTAGFDLDFLKVSNTPDGLPNYTPGTDWLHDQNISQDQIEWTTTGMHPAVGTTYYLTSASGQNATLVAPNTAYKVNGTTITFATAPTTGQAVFVEYVYGTHTATTLAYQQTSANDGGYNSIFIDSCYSGRYLGSNMAAGLAWLDGYSGLSTTLRTNTIKMLVAWSSYLTFTPNLWMHNSPESNYGAGDYCSDVLTALALCGRSPQAATLVSQVLGYRTAYVVPALTSHTISLYGGFWAEGWSYGTSGSQNMILAGLALEDSGLIPSATEERAWASQAVRSLIEEQAAVGTLYDAGDWYTTHPEFLSRNFFGVLGTVASDPLAASYANYIQETYPNSAFYLQYAHPNSIGMIFDSPTAPISYWSGEPLQYYASGTGLVTARSDWGSSPTLVTFQDGNLLTTGHQSYAPGQLEIFSGSNSLLVNSATLNGTQSATLKSSLSNTVVIDDGGAGYQQYRWSNSTLYGPGVGITAYEAAGNYVYAAGNYAGAYDSPGYAGSVSTLQREVVYLRPGEVVVYDRATTTQPQFSKQLRWHFSNAPTVTGNSFVETVGTAKLFGATLSTDPIATALVPVTVNGVTVQELQTQNTNTTAIANYVTAFQVATSTTTSMVTTTHIVSSNRAMEGTQIGSDVVLFGFSGQVTGGNPATYSFNGTGPTTHTLVDLVPGQSYRVQVNGTLLTTATASAAGVLTFTTNATGNQTVKII